MEVNGSDLAARYEDLRAQVLDGSKSVRSLGLAHLLRHGLAAWIAAWPDRLPSRQPEPEPRQDPDGALPLNIGSEVAVILAGMALKCRMEGGRA